MEDQDRPDDSFLEMAYEDRFAVPVDPSDVEDPYPDWMEENLYGEDDE